MRQRSEQAGYALIDLLVATAIVGIVAAGIVTIFQASLTQVQHATALEDAQSGARFALDRMVTDFRTIGAYWIGTPIITATPSTITFLGDIDADSVSGTTETTLNTTSTTTTLIVSGTPTAFNTYGDATLNDYAYVANGSVREVSQVSAVAGATITLATAITNSYPAGSVVRSVEKVTYTFDATSRTLTRRVGGGSTDTLLDNVSALTFSYFDPSGTALPSTPPDLSQVREVEVSVTAKSTGGGGGRMMVSRVRLRN